MVIGTRGSHVCMGYRSPASFGAAAKRFLATGAARGERTLLVPPDHAAAVYGDTDRFDPEALVASLGALVDEARADGYTGLRVVADGSPLIASARDTRPFACYEHLLDRLVVSSGSLHVMCGYNRALLGDELVKDMAVLHPTALPMDVPFHLSAGAGDDELVLSGELDMGTHDSLRRAVASMRWEGRARVNVDVADVTFMDRRSLQLLDDLAGRSGVTVVLHNPSSTVRVLVRILELTSVAT